MPVLGDIPIANTLFNERSTTPSRDAAIVLVTPRFAGSIDTGAREFRAETLAKLPSVWNEVVDRPAERVGTRDGPDRDQRDAEGVAVVGLRAVKSRARTRKNPRT